MKSSLIAVVVVVVLAVCGQLVCSEPAKKPESLDIWKVRDVLAKLEEARRANNWQPDVDNVAMSRVVVVMKSLTDEDLRYVEHNYPMVNRLFKSLAKNLSPASKGASNDAWWRVCDELCATNTGHDYLLRRRRDPVSRVAQDLEDTQVERLAKVLLRQSNEKLTVELIRAAMEEFQQFKEMSSDTADLSILSSLYQIEKYVDYFNRLSARIVAAMWPDYHMTKNYSNFAELFGEQFLEMLHQNGYGFRHGHISKIPKTPKIFVV